MWNDDKGLRWKKWSIGKIKTNISVIYQIEREIDKNTLLLYDSNVDGIANSKQLSKYNIKYDVKNLEDTITNVFEDFLHYMDSRSKGLLKCMINDKDADAKLKYEFLVGNHINTSRGYLSASTKNKKRHYTGALGYGGPLPVHLDSIQKIKNFFNDFLNSTSKQENIVTREMGELLHFLSGLWMFQQGLDNYEHLVYIKPKKIIDNGRKIKFDGLYAALRKYHRISKEETIKLLYSKANSVIEKAKEREELSKILEETNAHLSCIDFDIHSTYKPEVGNEVRFLYFETDKCILKLIPHDEGRISLSFFIPKIRVNRAKLEDLTSKKRFVETPWKGSAIYSYDGGVFQFNKLSKKKSKIEIGSWWKRRKDNELGAYDIQTVYEIAKLLTSN